jgi:excisionase family DNA binding protein
VLLKTKEVAARLSVSQATVYALVASGRLRHCRVGLGRGAIRVTEEQLEEYIRSSEHYVADAPEPVHQVRLKHIKI